MSSRTQSLCSACLMLLIIAATPTRCVKEFYYCIIELLYSDIDGSGGSDYQRSCLAEQKQQVFLRYPLVAINPEFILALRHLKTSCIFQICIVASTALLQHATPNLLDRSSCGDALGMLHAMQANGECRTDQRIFASSI